MLSSSFKFYKLNKTKKPILKLKNPNKIIKIRAKYTKDFDIIKIDKIIKDKYKDESKSNVIKKNNIKSEIDRKIDKIKNDDNSDFGALLEIKKLREKYKELNKDVLSEYIKNSEKILDSYKNLNPIKSSDFFESKKSSDIDYNRINIIETYLRIAEKYIDIKVFHDNPQEKICFGCGGDYENVEETDGVYFCIDCGLKSIHFNTHNNTIPSNSKYNSIKNYIETITCFQGKQNKIIPEYVFKTIDKYFIENNQVTREMSNSIPIDSKGKKKGTSLSLMLHTLKKTELTKYTKDCYLICKIYWGWKLFDLSSINTKLLEDYKKTSKCFLPTQYRLFKSLQMRGIDCDRYDFKITNENENIIKYDKIWKEQCENCSDPDIYFIETI